jgi:hypothetical protein
VALLSALLVLVAFDGAFSGFRAAAGTSGQIDKRMYYARAMGTGAVMGACVAALVGAVAVILAARAPSPLAFWQDVSFVVERLVCFFGPIAVFVSALLALRVVRSADMRSIASTLVFGPVTLLRPAVIVGGTAWAALGRAHHSSLTVLGAASAVAMLAVTPCLRQVLWRKRSALLVASRRGPKRLPS